MTVAAIVQARLRSTRLPAKVLLPLPTGRTVLEEVLCRAGQIEGVDVVVAAIPDTPACDLLLPYASSHHAVVVRGPEHDVLARYRKAAEAVGASVILRITADCPLIEPSVCAKVLETRARHVVGYCSNAWPARSFPHGWDAEAFTIGMLRRADEAARDPADREHVCPWMQRQDSRAFVKDMGDRSSIRWTLDTIDDYIAICAECNRRIGHGAEGHPRAA